MGIFTPFMTHACMHTYVRTRAHAHTHIPLINVICTCVDVGHGQATFLKKKNWLFPLASINRTFSATGWGSCDYPFHAEMLTDLNLCGQNPVSFVGSPSSCEFMRVMALSCLDGTIWKQSSLSSDSFYSQFLGAPYLSFLEATAAANWLILLP